MKITHCELLEDRLILITDEGRLCLDRDDAIRLAYGVVHYSHQLKAADLSEIFNPDFNWRLLKPVKNEIKLRETGCKTCAKPANWKPMKNEQKTD